MLLALHQRISWIFNCLRKADINCDTKMSPEEVKSFLQEINVEVEKEYVKMLFEVVIFNIYIHEWMICPTLGYTPCGFCFY